MIEELKATVSAAKLPVLWFSGSLASTLLLAMMREMNLNFYIVQMCELWTKEQAKRSDDLIKEWGLKVFSYAPADIYFIGDGKELSAVFEYSVGTKRVPIVRDVIDGTACIAELNGKRLNAQPIKWDLNIVGSRKDDVHYAMKQVIPSKRWEHGGTEFYAPLFEYSRSEIKQMAMAYGLSEVDEQADTGNISLCSNCLQGAGEVWCPKENKLIPSVDWNPKENLRIFQERTNG